MKIDCERIANAMLEEAKEGIALLKERGITPTLGIIRVGSDPASETYVRNKVKTCSELGIRCITFSLPEDISQIALDAHIHVLHDILTDGIILQLPLPEHLDAEKTIKLIPDDMDVDGLLPNSPCIPCTPLGIMNILDREGIELEGKHAVIVGRSNLVGKPLAKLLLERNCTVTVCHSKTEDLSKHTRSADILIAAVGKPGLIESYDIQSDAVVIDVGINRVDGKLVGDVSTYADMMNPNARITPVPGGVGKTTVAALACNLVQLALKRHGIDK